MSTNLPEGTDEAPANELVGGVVGGDMTQREDGNADETVRLVVLLNKRLEPGPALNAACHLGAGIVNVIGEAGRKRLKFLDFSDADGQSHPSISARSLIVLRGTSAEIRSLRQRAREAGIAAIDFTASMTGGTYHEQLERTARTPEAELEYFGVILFGKKEDLSGLTKKYSLWR